MLLARLPLGEEQDFGRRQGLLVVLMIVACVKGPRRMEPLEKTSLAGGSLRPQRQMRLEHGNS